MEKPRVKPKGSNILRFLPKATSFTVNNTPYSPGRERAHAHRAFSGPILPMIPAEARRRGREVPEAPEPTSPRVTCVGKIKFRKEACRTKERRACFTIGGWLFRRRTRQGRRGGDAEVDEGRESPVAVDQAPPLGQLRRFATGREGLRDFEWGDSGVAEEKEEERPDAYTEDEESEEEEEEEEEVGIPRSEPVEVGGDVNGVAVQPRKEVNLWKRRTVAPPIPLQL